MSQPPPDEPQKTPPPASASARSRRDADGQRRMGGSGDGAQYSRDTLEYAGAQDPEIQSVHAQLLREKPEPTEGFSPMPMFLVFLFAFLFFVCGVYLAQRSGQFKTFATSPDWQPGVQAEAPEVDLLTVGQRVFSQQCSTCHQSDGNGVSGVYPPLVASSWVTEEPGKIVSILLHGMQGPVEVKGNVYNGVMPAFSQLSDRQLAGVITYVRQSWGNAASEVTEEQLAEFRAEKGSRGAWGADELLALYPKDE